MPIPYIGQIIMFAASGNPNAALAAAAMSSMGGEQPHENRMPFLTLNFCICVDHGAPYPPRG